MKTPDEIKKGLAVCIDRMSVCNEVCPYADVIPFPKCREKLLNDAFLLVQQLEEKIPKWISVEERLPEENFDVLMLFEHNMAVGYYEYGVDDVVYWFAYTDDGSYTDCDCEPTHWMPLPETEEK